MPIQEGAKFESSTEQPKESVASEIFKLVSRRNEDVRRMGDPSQIGIERVHDINMSYLVVNLTWPDGSRHEFTVDEKGARPALIDDDTRRFDLTTEQLKMLRQLELPPIS